ncbi:MAG: thioredoxin domain-containing protein [Myxococcales bacterium]|nr:thioredoxin domain-containing protein [Myxococcales bacterium]
MRARLLTIIAIGMLFASANLQAAKKTSPKGKLREQFFNENRTLGDAFRDVGDCKRAIERYTLALKWAEKTQKSELEQKIASCKSSGPAIKRVPIAAHTPCIGPKKTYVTIVEFSDFQCPFCARATRTIEQIRKAYGGKVRVCFVNLPLSFHRNAKPAALVALAAAKQDRFWEFHDELFRHSRRLSPEVYTAIAKRLKLDLGRFEADRYGADVKRWLELDLQLARRVGARGTPSFLVNGKRLVGAQPFERFAKLIDTEIARAKLLLKQGVSLAGLYDALTVPFRSSEKGPSRSTAIHKAPLPKGTVCKGPKHALVTILEYSEFQCPYCKRAQPTLAKIAATWPKEVRICFAHFPLPFHPNAFRAAMAALAAAKQGKFWPLHDKMFENQHKLGPDDLLATVKALGIDLKRFMKDVQNEKMVQQVRDHITAGRKAGVRGTPTFLINGVRLGGAHPFENFKPIIEAQLLRAKKMLKSKGVNRRNLYAKLIEKGIEAPEPKPNLGPTVYYKAEIPKGTPCKGPRDAWLTIVEYSDFQCPYCSRAAGTMAEILRKWHGKVRLCYLNNPLPFHQHAFSAAIASLAALRQGKFWEFHDKLFENYRMLSAEKLLQIASALKLDIARFKRDLADPKLKARVQRDLELAERVNARGTPIFYINGRRLVGARPYEHFHLALDEELKRAKDALKRKDVTRRNLYASLIKNGRTMPGPETVGPVQKLPIGGSPVWGDKNAKVTVVVFSDFQCPFCSRMAFELERASRRFTKGLRIVFKHFPLSFHKMAMPAALASLAAQRQGKFWEFHNRLFRYQRELSPKTFDRIAEEIGLNLARFKKDLADKSLSTQVKQDLDLGNRVKVEGTPTIFINGRTFQSPGGYTARHFERIFRKLGI